MPEERLQKFLASAGLCSRRKAEELIQQGRITIDGTIVTELGMKIDPERHTVACDGVPVVRPEGRKVYILMNKPRGVVTTASDPQGRPTVLSLLTGIRERVFPVGRLDIDTEGALLLTNDGELANRIIHPRFEINKTYHVVVRGQVAPQAVRDLEQGILLEGKKTWPASIRILEKKETVTRLSIVIHEGRKRQVRKMFEAVGHPVLALKRVAYGNLRLGPLPSGSYRFLSPQDLDSLFSGKSPLTKKKIPS